ncbi:MAG: M50 family metallopeptidase [Beijerinckiaceae bacterium]
MSFLSAMGANLWSVASYALPFLFVLCLVVFIHELGHFLAGRLCGVKINSFSVGFGPELFGFTDRHGTRWKFSAIPLGGYVKFHGDLNVASVPDAAGAAAMSAEERSYSFPHKPVGQRAFIVAAGPLANFILSIVLFAGIAMFAGRWVLEPYVGSVRTGSVAEKAEFKAGDKVKSINGQEMYSFETMQRFVSARPGELLTVVVARNGADVILKATPELSETKTRLGVDRRGLLGLQASTDVAHRRLESFNPLSALLHGAGETWFVVERTMAYVGKLIIGQESPDQLSGLPRIVQASGEISKTGGFIGLLGLTALMSVSIGLLNLFPIPLLDGGHLMFYAYEWIRKRPLSERKQEVGFKIGFALVMMLMIYATWNDIMHFVSL